MRNLLPILLFLFALPCSAQGVDNPQARFCKYVQQTYGVGLVNCAVQSANDANLAGEILCPAGTPQATINNIVNDAQNPPSAFGGWTPKPLPNVNQAEVDIWNDSVTKPIVGQLMFYYPLLEKNYGPYASAADISYVQSMWAGITASPPAWLTPAIITAIEGHCSANNVILAP